MGGEINTKTIVVTVQENGIIRDRNGQIIARINEDVDYGGTQSQQDRIRELEGALEGILSTTTPEFAEINGFNHKRKECVKALRNAKQEG